MKAHPVPHPAGPAFFSEGLTTRLELMADRVGSEQVHLDQIAAVAASYVEPLPSPIRLVR